MANKYYGSSLINLKRVIASSSTVHNRQLPGFTRLPKIFVKPIPESTDRSYYGVDCDEVYPNIFIGDEGSARNQTFLKMLGITHIVNTAEGNGLTMVSTGNDFYSDIDIKYLGINVLDTPQAMISTHFEECANFIEMALNDGGRVLVHCLMGRSRSVTITIAYLMIKKKMSAEEALKNVRRHRDIHPNDGFLRQLLELETQLIINTTK